MMRGREFVGSRWIPRMAAAAAAAVVLIAGVWLTVRIIAPGELGRSVPWAVAPGGLAEADSLLAADAVQRYRGPAVSRMGTRIDGFGLEYRPSTAEPLLAVFRVRSVDDRGRVVDQSATAGNRPYVGALCRESCLDIVLDLDGASRTIRLPVPTGHLLDPASIRIEGGSATLWSTADGAPTLEFNEGSGHRVAYRTGAAREASLGSVVTWPSLPVEAEDFALRLRPLAATQAAATAAQEWVQRRVVYDTSVDTILRHRAAARSGLGFAERCLAVGAGDCDVQNALLAAILHRAGIEVRMAVGLVGAAGRALPGLHAWVEYRAPDGVWRAADASRGAARRLPSTTGIDEKTDPTTGVDPGPFPASRGGGVAIGSEGRRTSVVALVGLIGLLAAALLLHRRRETATVVGSDVADLAGLLSGALATPDAFGEIPALFTRPVVPLVGGSSISLRRARSLGRRGMLAVGSTSGKLARRAAVEGARVIDAGRTEGTAVAAVLGAVDLDRWDRVVTGVFEHPLTCRLEREAAEVGEDWAVCLSDAVDEIGVLEGCLTGRSKESLLVAVGSGGEPWRRIVELGDREPAAAVLFLAEKVLERCRVQPRRAWRVLSRLATAALLESEEGRR